MKGMKGVKGMKNDPLAETFDEAMRLRDAGRYEDAVKLLETLTADRIDKRARLVGIHCQLGNLYTFHLDSPEKGELHFRKGVRLKPSSELSSLGLFHSLMAQK
jgi:hypothetical protein